MKSKEITTATQVGNHYDDVAIFRVKDRFGFKMVRLMTETEIKNRDRMMNYSHRNINKAGFVSVVEVVAVDAVGEKQQWNDFNFICAAVIDNFTHPSHTYRQLDSETLPINQFMCHLNSTQSIVDFVNVKNDIDRGSAEANKVAAARQAAEEAAHAERVTEIQQRVTGFFDGDHVAIYDNYKYESVKISSVRLLELVKAAEAAKNAGLI
jgi:hypothetical protein